MSGAVFVKCSFCDRLMLGRLVGGDVYPQPHRCEAER